MSRTILVADDNEVSRELIREILRPAGFTVLEAADGREALERIEAATPDLVLLDIQMPAMDGFAVIRQLRGDPRFRGLRVLALTAYAMEEDRRRALEAGFDGYMAKPVSVGALRREIARFFGRQAAAGV